MEIISVAFVIPNHSWNDDKITNCWELPIDAYFNLRWKPYERNVIVNSIFMAKMTIFVSEISPFFNSYLSNYRQFTSALQYPTQPAQTRETRQAYDH